MIFLEVIGFKVDQVFIINWLKKYQYAEPSVDEDVLKFLRDLMGEIDTNDWSKNVLITLISDAGTRTFAVDL